MGRDLLDWGCSSVENPDILLPCGFEGFSEQGNEFPFVRGEHQSNQIVNTFFFLPATRCHERH